MMRGRANDSVPRSRIDGGILGRGGKWTRVSPVSGLAFEPERINTISRQKGKNARGRKSWPWESTKRGRDTVREIGEGIAVAYEMRCESVKCYRFRFIFFPFSRGRRGVYIKQG